MCVHVRVYTRSCARMEGKARVGGLELCREFQIHSGLIYFIFSFMAINWLLNGGSVQLSISSSAIK